MSETVAKTPAPASATAYSYIRLSSKRQANSEEKKAYRDGFRRQVEMREEYLAANPHLTLDTTLSLHDIGVSGYTQANSAPGGHGKLAAFQRAVDEGRVARGSYLLVESLDRMTRAQVNVAQHMLLGLVNAGIIVVSLTDKMVYRAAPDDPAQQANFMYSVMTLMRAHEESRMKSKRLRATWDKKREDITQRKLTAKCPSWLTLKDGEFVPVEERVEIVRDVLGMLADGFGRDRIAAVLNARGVKPWGIGNQWHGGTVQKLTESRAIIGEFQPCKLVFEERKGILVSKRVPVGAPVPNYFPTVVSQDLWDRARAVAVKRRMGKAPNAGGRQGTVVSNLFGMIAKCSTCGRTMNYRERGSRSTPVLRCSGERSGNCSNSYRFPYREMEDAALSWMLKLDLSAGAPGEMQKLEDTLRTKLARRDALQAEGEAIVGEIGRGSRFAQAPLARIEAAMEVVEVEIANLTAGITALRDAGGQDERRAAIHLVMDLNRRQAPDDERFAIRSRLRQMLRDTITSMMCEPDGHIRITTIDGQEHLFRDGFWFQDGEWLPWAGGFFGLHPKITKAEKARRAQWLQEAREALWKARQGEGGADSPKADMAS